MGEGDIWQYTYIYHYHKGNPSEKKSCDQDTKGNNGY